MVSVVNGLVLTLFGVKSVRSGFIVIVCMYLAAQFTFMPGCLCWTALGHNCSVNEKVEFKGGEDVL